MAGGEHVEHRHGGVGGELLDHRVGTGADADRGDVAREHQGRVADRLAAADLQLVGPQDHRMTAELEHADLERHPGPGRRRLEDQRHRAPGQHLGRQRLRLQRGRAVDQRRQLGGGQLLPGQELARQAPQSRRAALSAARRAQPEAAQHQQRLLAERAARRQHARAASPRRRGRRSPHAQQPLVLQLAVEDAVHDDEPFVAGRPSSGSRWVASSLHGAATKCRRCRRAPVRSSRASGNAAHSRAAWRPSASRPSSGSPVSGSS